MGGKPRYKGNNRFFYITCVLIFFVLGIGCQHGNFWQYKTTVMEKKAWFHLNKAEQNIQDKAFEESLAHNYKSVDVLPYDAIFQKGVIYAHPECEFRNYEKAREYFLMVIQKRDSVSPAIYNKSRVYVSLIDAMMENRSVVQQLEADAVKQTKAADVLKQKIAELKARNTDLKTQAAKYLEEIAALKKQIENLKEVDLNLEEKKLEPLYK